MSQIKAVQTFVEQLPTIIDIEPQSEAYWNRLGVWHKRIVNQRLHDPGLVTTRLNQLGVGFLQALSLWLGLPAEKKRKDALLTGVAANINEGPMQTWCQDLFLLTEFVENKSHEAVATIGRLLLPETLANLINDGTFTVRAQRLANAMQMYYRNPANMSLLRFFEEAEKSGYTRYTLVPKAEESGLPVREDEAEDAAREIQKGYSLSAMTVPAEIDLSLKEFESRLPKGKGRRSECAQILHENENSVLVFIRRILKEASIEEMDQTLFGDQVEIIVLKFGDRLRTLEEHSSRKVGVGMAGAIASRLLKAKVEYIDDSSLTSVKSIRRFLLDLCKQRNKHMRLVEIYFEQAPIQNSPKLIVRCDKEETLAPSLYYLAKQGVYLLNLTTLKQGLKAIKYIGVAYDRRVKSTDKPYIFKLRFFPTNDGFYHVCYSRQRLSRVFRRKFEKHLKDTYNVKAIPALG